MFDSLKKFISGDTRPIRRALVHPVLGTLVYSDDYEGWFTNASSPLGFTFCIAGDWSIPGPEVLPPPSLIDAAVKIASDSEAFKRLVQDVIDTQLKKLSPRDRDFEEIKNLQVQNVALMWPDKPNEGEIELKTSPSSNRVWCCGYMNGKPILPLSCAGLDD